MLQLNKLLKEQGTPVGGYISAFGDFQHPQFVKIDYALSTVLQVADYPELAEHFPSSPVEIIIKPNYNIAYEYQFIRVNKAGPVVYKRIGADLLIMVVRLQNGGGLRVELHGELILHLTPARLTLKALIPTNQSSWSAAFSVTGPTTLSLINPSPTVTDGDPIHVTLIDISGGDAMTPVTLTIPPPGYTHRANTREL